MGKILGKMLIVIMPFLICYTILAGLYTGVRQENVLIKVSTLMQDLGNDGNFWYETTQYWNNEIVPAWDIIKNGGNIIDWLSSIGKIIILPIDISINIGDDIIHLFVTIFKFLTFQ